MLVTDNDVGLAVLKRPGIIVENGVLWWMSM